MKYYQSLHPTSSLAGGYLLVLVLVFSSIFFVLLLSFMGYIVTQSKVVSQRAELQRAGDIAEAGLNYYKWYLAHFPNDTTNGTGLPGPYVVPYNDPEEGPIGEFSISIASTTFCGEVASLDVTSTGYTYADPSVRRTFTAHYARPTVAEYSFIINSNVWAGPSRVIIGPYHSNGGIRMDGRNNSTVTSGQASWNCTESFGCDPALLRDGVFTTTSSSSPTLFSFPSPPINFTGLTVDLAAMQDRAQNGGGIHIPPSGAFGYHLVFNSNDTVTVRRVTNTTSYIGYSLEFGNQTERNVISGSAPYATFTIPTGCPLIFVQDKVWLEGTIRNKVSLAVADVGSAVLNPSIILNGNITYTSATSSGLLAIAEQDILVGLNVPNVMTVNGIFIAQTGRFARNHYRTSNLPAALDPFVFRESLSINGTIVSNGRVGTQWTSGGTTTSGFRNNTNTYDRYLVADPPPLIPTTSDVFEMIDWREER